MRFLTFPRVLLAGVTLIIGVSSLGQAAEPARPQPMAAAPATPEVPRAPHIAPDMKGCQAIKINRDYYVKYVMPQGKSQAAQKQEPTAPPRSMRDRIVGFFSMK